MANTYTQINIHVVFAVKGRTNILNNELSLQLFKYINGILSNGNQFPLAIGGYRNHVHIFFELNPDTKLSDIVRDIKANSSRWINENNFFKSRFEWQRGYGGFSYSRSQRDGVIKYIMQQEKHHKKKTFREEYLEILEKFDIKFENEYLFEFYE